MLKKNMNKVWILSCRNTLRKLRRCQQCSNITSDLIHGSSSTEACARTARNAGSIRVTSTIVGKTICS